MNVNIQKRTVCRQFIDMNTYICKDIHIITLKKKQISYKITLALPIL